MADAAHDWAAEFAAWLTDEGRAANTVAAYRRDVTAYLRWCAGPGLAAEHPLAAYVQHVRAARRPSSAARAIVALRIFHRWRDDGHGAAGPLPELAGLPKPAAAVEEPELPEDVVDRLRAATGGESAGRRRDAVAIALLYFAGLKASEAISLDVNDVGPEGAVLTVDRDGPHERLLPVVPALREALHRWLEPKGRNRLQPATAAVLVNRRGQRLTRQGLWLLTGAVGRRAGLPETLSPNDLRKACAGHLARHEVPAAEVNAFLGYSRGPLPSLRILNRAGWGGCNVAV